MFYNWETSLTDVKDQPRWESHIVRGHCFAKFIHQTVLSPSWAWFFVGCLALVMEKLSLSFWSIDSSGRSAFCSSGHVIWWIVGWLRRRNVQMKGRVPGRHRFCALAGEGHWPDSERCQLSKGPHGGKMVSRAGWEVQDHLLAHPLSGAQWHLGWIVSATLWWNLTPGAQRVSSVLSDAELILMVNVRQRCASICLRICYRETSLGGIGNSTCLQHPDFPCQPRWQQLVVCCVDFFILDR